MSFYLDGGPSGVPTSARVDITTPNNATWEDAFQFDPTGATGSSNAFWPPGLTGPQWTLFGQNHKITIKGNRLQTAAALIIDSGVTGSTVVITDDPNNRILHVNVPDTVMTGGVTGWTGVTGPGLIPGTYVYDWVMYDGSSPPIKVQMMHGKFVMADGVGAP
jgi:hypothetical protein